MKVLFVAYDNDSNISFFPQGIAYLAAVLINAGHEVDIWQQDIEHYPDAELTPYIDDTRPDMVGVGVIAGYWQFKRLLGLSEAINRAKNRPYFVIGGHGPSPEPEYFMEKTGADCLVIGEAEAVNFSFAGNKHKVSPFAIEVHPMPIDDIPWPAYNLFQMKIYRLIKFPTTTRTEFAFPILSGRGCKWPCNFCYRMTPGLRGRDPKDVIEEMWMLKKQYGIHHFQFSDELLMSSEARAILFSEEIIKSGLKIKWDCNGRLNFASRQVLKVMKKSGCSYINYGIEALDDRVLETMGKGLTVEQITTGVEATINAGLVPGLNIIWGNIYDTLETLQAGVDFLLKYSGTHELRTIRPVTPYPGSPLYDKAIEWDILEGPADFYENKHINSDLLTVNFTTLSDDEFHLELMKANRMLYHNYKGIRIINRSYKWYPHFMSRIIDTPSIQYCKFNIF